MTILPGGGVFCPCEIAAQSGDLGQIRGQGFGFADMVWFVGDETIEQLHLNGCDRHFWFGAGRGAINHGHPEYAPGQDTEDGDQPDEPLGGPQFGFFCPATGFQNLMENLDFPAHRVPMQLLNRVGGRLDREVGD